MENTNDFMRKYEERTEALKQKRLNPPPCTCSGPHASSATTADICAVLGRGRDHEAHHVLWVCWNGHINLTKLERSTPPTSLDDKPEFKFRLETFCRWNGYVGEKASRDLDWVRRLKSWIHRAWTDGATGYLDY